MAKGNPKEAAITKSDEEDSAAIAVQQVLAPSMGHLPLDELVAFIQGQGSKKGKSKR